MAPGATQNPGHRSAANALTVVLDLAAPIIVFDYLRWTGVGVFMALIAGAIAPGLSMLLKVTKDISTAHRAKRVTGPARF